MPRPRSCAVSLLLLLLGLLLLPLHPCHRVHTLFEIQSAAWDHILTFTGGMDLADMDTDVHGFPKPYEFRYLIEQLTLSGSFKRLHYYVTLYQMAQLLLLIEDGESLDALIPSLDPKTPPLWQVPFSIRCRNELGTMEIILDPSDASLTVLENGLTALFLSLFEPNDLAQVERIPNTTETLGLGLYQGKYAITLTVHVKLALYVDLILHLIDGYRRVYFKVRDPVVKQHAYAILEASWV